MNEWESLTAREWSRLIQTREMGVEEGVRWALERCEAQNAEGNAFIFLDWDGAMIQARQVQAALDRGEMGGPLAGVPLGVKDNLCTRGVPTTCASRMLENFVPPYDATVVERVKQAGVIVLGKTNMDEFAMGSTNETSAAGPVKNPWDRRHMPGGSSGGSAAAVAAGLVPLALGTDTGGSIRQPAAFCGVVGLKPTYGRVSRFGMIAHASSLDQIGPMARNVEDAAALFSILSGADGKDSTMSTRPAWNETLTGQVAGLRVGLPRECWEEMAPVVRRTLLEAAEALRDAGALVEECSIPELRLGPPCYDVLACAEAASNLGRFDGLRYGYRGDGETLPELVTKNRSEGFGPEVKRRILAGTYVLTGDKTGGFYQTARAVQARIRRGYEEAFARFDLLLTPAAPIPAPFLRQAGEGPQPKLKWGDVNTAPVNLAGLPGLALPVGRDEQGLPLGAQLVGRAFDETTLFNAGLCWERAGLYDARIPGKEGADGGI